MTAPHLAYIGGCRHQPGLDESLDGWSTCPQCGALGQWREITALPVPREPAPPGTAEVDAPTVTVDPPALADDEGGLLGSWAPVDLGPYLRGEVVRPVPSVGLARSDGVRMLYSGKEHSVLGEMESGKSWWCSACAAAEINAGHHVVYVHFEESDPGGTIERLRALGTTAGDIAARLRFVAPEQRVTPAALAVLLDPAPTLVVLDGVNEAMSLHGWEIRDESGAALFRRFLVKPCTRAGAATLAADHVVKDVERRGRSAIGSVHKVNGLSGALIMLENAEPFGRGQRGRSHVFVTKDRPGALRRHGRSSAVVGKTYVGELIVDDTQTWSPDLELRFHAPRNDAAQEGALAGAPTVADQVYEVLTGLDGQAVSSERELLAAVRAAEHSYRKTTVQSAVDDLLVAGRIDEVPGKRGARGYRVRTASQDPHRSTASRTASATASPLEGGRGTQSRSTAPGPSGTQSDAVEGYERSGPGDASP